MRSMRCRFNLRRFYQLAICQTRVDAIETEWCLLNGRIRFRPVRSSRIRLLFVGRARLIKCLRTSLPKRTRYSKTYNDEECDAHRRVFACDDDENLLSLGFHFHGDVRPDCLPPKVASRERSAFRSHGRADNAKWGECWVAHLRCWFWRRRVSGPCFCSGCCD